MTTTLERASSPGGSASSTTYGATARAWGGWRVALRLARRDAWRSRGRSLLVVLLIALPVAGVTGVDVYAHAERAARSTAASALRDLGDTADGRVVLGSGGPVRQGLAAEVGNYGDPGLGTPPTPRQVLAALPPGSRLAPVGSMVGVAIEAGEWGVAGSVSLMDTSDPLLAGLWRVQDGRLPAATTEIALRRDEARRIRADVGDVVLLTPLAAATGSTGRSSTPIRLTVVGLVTSDAVSSSGVALPGAVAAPVEAGDGSGESFLLAASRPLTWPDVRAVNAVGAVVVSRSVLESPPAFCPGYGRICLDAGHVPLAPGEGTLEPVDPAEQARQAALAGVVVVLVVLQIALLAGPAFAVQLRRRQRELGLVAASGGDAAVLRRTVLASGIVLGAVGAAVGVALGWAAVWLAGGALPWRPLASVVDAPLGVPPLAPEVLLVAVVGVLSAVAAAAVPAVIAGRGDVVDTLRGRRPLAAVPARRPVLGLVLGGAGLLAMVYGTTTLDPVVLGLGVIVGELGVVVLMPYLVVQAGRVGRWLPLTSRVAVRDAGRHRMRTTAAACAIAAAAAGAVAVSSWAQSELLQSSASDVTFVDGTVLVQVQDTYDDSGRVATSAHDAAVGVTGTVAGAVPDGRPVTVGDVLPTSADPQLGNGTLSCVVLPESSPATDLGEFCQGRTARTGGFGGFEVGLVSDPSRLDVVLGPLAPIEEARRVLEAGGAVVLQPGSLDTRGRVALRPALYSVEDLAPLPTLPVVRLPAVEVLSGALPASVLVGPAALAKGGLLHDVARPGGYVLVAVRPDSPDTADRPTTADRIALALLTSGRPASVVEQPSVLDPVAVVLAAGVAVTALMALLAGLMVTALALADGRADLMTFAAVGAPPGSRRRIAASSAGFVSLLGCVVGAAAGLLAARVLVPLLTRFRGEVFVTPWLSLALVVLAVPLLTAAVAFVTTRSRVVLTRRLDS